MHRNFYHGKQLHVSHVKPSAEAYSRCWLQRVGASLSCVSLGSFTLTEKATSEIPSSILYVEALNVEERRCLECI